MLPSARIDIRFAEAFVAGQPIRLYASKTRGAQDFAQLGTNIVEALANETESSVSTSPSRDRSISVLKRRSSQKTCLVAEGEIDMSNAKMSAILTRNGEDCGDHSNLFSLVALLVADMLSGKSEQDGDRASNELSNYITTYFATPEELMGCGYSVVSVKHQEFLYGIHDLRNNVESGSTAAISNLLTFLFDWLAREMKRNDKAIVDALPASLASDRGDQQSCHGQTHRIERTYACRAKVSATESEPSRPCLISNSAVPAVGRKSKVWRAFVRKLPSRSPSGLTWRRGESGVLLVQRPCGRVRRATTRPMTR